MRYYIRIGGVLLKKKIGPAGIAGLLFLVFALLIAGCESPTSPNDNGRSDNSGSDNEQSDNPLGDSGDQEGTSEDTAEGHSDAALSGISTSAFVYVEPGSFQRDSTETNISVITQGFRMSAYPVTQADFESLMGTNPSQFKGDDDAPNRPVERVNWYHAIAFANRLSIERGRTPVYSVSGVDFAELNFDDIPRSSSNAWNNAAANWSADGYRLPTEMERLWAAMGATSGNDYSGSGVYTTGYTKAFPGSDGTNDPADYAWYWDNSLVGSQRSPHPVGQKLPNELGLYDLSGNVGEWVWDRNRTSLNYPVGTLTDHRGNDDTSVVRRVTRGGNWGSGVSDLAIAGPNGLGFGGRDPWTQSNSFGFRLVRNDAP